MHSYNLSDAKKCWCEMRVRWTEIKKDKKRKIEIPHRKLGKERQIKRWKW